MPWRDEVARNLLRIVEAGILRIRGQAMNSAMCFAEADHLHSLPSLIAHPTPELLRFYLDVTREDYVQKVRHAADLEPYWAELERLFANESARN